MMKNKMRLLGIILTFIVSLPARDALANDFSMNAASCVPEHKLPTNPRSVTSGAVTHVSGYTGTIVLYCSIPVTISAPGNLELLYSSTANTSTIRVNADYIKMHRTTGAITVVATASSNSGVNDGTPRTVTTSFSDSYSQSTYAYYVRIWLNRSNNTDVVKAYHATVY